MGTETHPAGLAVAELKPPQRQGGAWLCRLEDGTRLKVTQGEVGDFALHPGRMLTWEELAALDEAAQRSLLRRRAMNILALRPHSAGELTDKLITKGAAPQAARETAQWAQELGLLGDADYAAQLVSHYSAKGYGLYKIKSELHRRKVPRELWDDALAQLPEGDGAIDRYLEKHLHSDDRKDVKRVSDALARRGFSWGEIARGLERRRRAEE